MRAILIAPASQLFLLAWVLYAPGEVRADEHEIVRGTRTSHSRFVHRIKLLDHEGKEITAQSAVPYSPRKTCAHCHNYDTISRGTHTRMFPPDRIVPDSPPGHIWTVFDPATGIQFPVSYGFLAFPNPAPGEDKSRKQFTVFDFAVQFGAFHPGGGRLELDRDGNRYDTRLRQSPALRSEADPDYLRSRWDQSGALEIDCLVCHSLASYDHAERAAQIAVMNFQWAPVAGSGFGCVSGKVAQLPLPAPGAAPDATARPAVQVKYDEALFDPEGRVHFEIGSPPDRNCLFCHTRRAIGEDSWQDSLDADIHSKSGLRCVACHSGGIEHIIPGPATAEQCATLTCEGCHSTGRLGAPVPRHKGLPRLHLESIACEACHAGPKPGVTPMRFEQPTDPLWAAILHPTKPSGPTVWLPILAKDGDGRLRAYVRMLPQWFAQRSDAGLEPLSPQAVVPVFFRLAKKEIKDDDGDGMPEINSGEEIAAMLEALKKRGDSPVYLAGGKIFQLDEGLQLKSKAEPLADPIDRPLAHNVRAARQSLGAAGCAECHGSDSPFFLSMAPITSLGGEGKPAGPALFVRLGKTKLDLRLGALREEYLRPYAPHITLLFIFLMALHYILFGPRRYQIEEPDEQIARFSPLERIAHFALVICLLVLVITGFALASGMEKILRIGTSDLHRIVAVVFIAAAVIAALLWLRDMTFSRIDWAWLKRLGGYLGYKRPLPAARFNAGQKVFFWFLCLVVACAAATGFVMMFQRPPTIVALAYTLHDLCAYATLLAILAHVYLGAIANPGTLRGIFEGKVSKAWLKHHHPDDSSQQNT